MKNNAMIKPNSNFHHVAGENLYENEDSRFMEYRRKWNEWPQNFNTENFPLFIDIETTSNCNLKCPFCATIFLGRRIKKGFVSSNTVRKIIDEGKDFNLYGVKFNIRGEPLLHPEIHEFVRYAKKNGLIDVYFNTNAMLLTEEVAKKLIDAGLDRVSISFEGYTKDVYERYRVGANYETVLSNIENMQILKKKLSVQHPKIRIQTIMFSDLKPTFKKYEKFWIDRVDEISFLDYKQMKDKKKGIQYPWACPQIWQRMAIRWDGTILPCNHDDDGLTALGNINEMTIKDAWHSGKLKQIREMHKAGKAHEIRACDGCYLRDSEILKLMEKEKNI